MPRSTALRAIVTGHKGASRRKRVKERDGEDSRTPSNHEADAASKPTAKPGSEPGISSIKDLENGKKAKKGTVKARTKKSSKVEKTKEPTRSKKGLKARSNKWLKEKIDDSSKEKKASAREKASAKEKEKASAKAKKVPTKEKKAPTKEKETPTEEKRTPSTGNEDDLTRSIADCTSRVPSPDPRQATTSPDHKPARKRKIDEVLDEDYDEPIAPSRNNRRKSARRSSRIHASPEDLPSIKQDEDATFGVAPENVVTGGNMGSSGVPHHDIAAPGMEAVTSEAVEALLPDPMFEVVFPWIKEWQVWTVQDEEDFQKRAHGPNLQMAQSAVNLLPERNLWRVMIKLYNRTPIDLFRYGLRFRLARNKQVDIELSDGIVKSYQYTGLPQTICNNLALMMSHPIWKGDIARVRYVLQMAVCARVQDHIPPLGPDSEIFKNGQSDVLWDHLATSPELTQADMLMLVGDYQYQRYLEGGARADADLADVVQRLQATTHVQPAKNDSERLLFVLAPSDVVKIIGLLDSAQYMGQRKWPTCEEWSQQYRTAAGSHYSAYVPHDDEMLIAWKTQWGMSEAREKEIRARLRQQGRDDILFDMPCSDTHPLQHYSPRWTDDMRRVFSGTVYSEDVPQLPAAQPRPEDPVFLEGVDTTASSAPSVTGDENTSADSSAYSLLGSLGQD